MKGKGILPAFAAGLFLAAALASAPAADAAGGVDATTSATIDAVTGASKTLEPVQISDDFSVPYALNRDGALFILSADLADAYQRNELASDAIFKDKLVVVKGEIEKMSKPDAAKPWVTLAGDPASGKKVRCSLRPGQLLEKKVAVGDAVQVRGSCGGMKLSVVVADGEVLD